MTGLVSAKLYVLPNDGYLEVDQKAKAHRKLVSLSWPRGGTWEKNGIIDKSVIEKMTNPDGVDSEARKSMHFYNYFVGGSRGLATAFIVPFAVTFTKVKQTLARVTKNREWVIEGEDGILLDPTGRVVDASGEPVAAPEEIEKALLLSNANEMTLDELKAIMSKKVEPVE